jgi:TctA family transporter
MKAALGFLADFFLGAAFLIGFFAAFLGAFVAVFFAAFFADFFAAFAIMFKFKRVNKLNFRN